MHRNTVLLCLLAAFGSACFPHQPGPRLAHFETQAPQVGERAPDFILHDLDGEPVALADLVRDKPVVLQFGSHTCPVYRYRRFGMAKVHEDYQDRVHFLVVYTLEAHPVGSKSPYAEEEWDTWWNRVARVRVEQPADAEARLDQARFSHDKLELTVPMVVDTMDDGTWQDYGAASSPAFVLDREGRVVLRQVWTDPKEIRQALDDLLAEP